MLIEIVFYQLNRKKYEHKRTHEHSLRIKTSARPLLQLQIETPQRVNPKGNERSLFYFFFFLHSKDMNRVCLLIKS